MRHRSIGKLSSRISENLSQSQARNVPRASGLWIPAGAGMTVVIDTICTVSPASAPATVVPANAGIQSESASRCLHTNTARLDFDNSIREAESSAPSFCHSLTRGRSKPASGLDKFPALISTTAPATRPSHRPDPSNPANLTPPCARLPASYITMSWHWRLISGSTSSSTRRGINPERSFQHAGIVRSMLVTCRLHGVCPQECLPEVIKRIGQRPAAQAHQANS
jgi:hypothetical protein